MTPASDPLLDPRFPALLRWAQKINPDVTAESLAALLKGLKAKAVAKKRRGVRQ